MIGTIIGSLVAEASVVEAEAKEAKKAEHMIAWF
jgi:hypothetical protein